MQNIRKIIFFCSLKQHLPGNSAFSTKTPLVQNVDLAQKLFDFPDRMSAYTYARRFGGPMWNKLDPEAATKSFEFLRSLGRSIDEIAQHPDVLMQPPSVLKNRHSVLAEIKFQEVKVFYLIKFIQLTHRPVRLLKVHGCIPEDVDVAAELCRHLHLEPFLGREAEEQPLTDLRKQILDAYLSRKLGFSDDQLRSMWKKYQNRVRQRSFQLLHRTVRLLCDRLGFEPQRIIRNAFLLQADADHVEDFLNRFPTLGGKDTVEVVRARPRLLLTGIEHIAAVLDELRRFGLTEEAIQKRYEILGYSAATVRVRLAELEQVPEFDVLRTNPRILNLVMHQIKAKARLNYLNQIKIGGASLNMLSTATVHFERYVREGMDRGKGTDLLNYLAKELRQPFAELKAKLARHSNWSHTVLKNVPPRLELLRGLGFTNDDILQCVWIVLYPKSIVETKLKEVDALRDSHIDLRSPTPAQKLNLCLYLIEREHHFTGDGVWQPEVQEPTTEDQNLDVPRHTDIRYRYGISPTGGRLNVP